MLVGVFFPAGWIIVSPGAYPKGHQEKKESIIFSHFMFKSITLITL